jgi:hypothetical protein
VKLQGAEMAHVAGPAGARDMLSAHQREMRAFTYYHLDFARIVTPLTFNLIFVARGIIDHPRAITRIAHYRCHRRPSSLFVDRRGRHSSE